MWVTEPPGLTSQLVGRDIPESPAQIHIHCAWLPRGHRVPLPKQPAKPEPTALRPCGPTPTPPERDHKPATLPREAPVTPAHSPLFLFKMTGDQRDRMQASVCACVRVCARVFPSPRVS